MDIDIGFGIFQWSEIHAIFAVISISQILSSWKIWLPEVY